MDQRDQTADKAPALHAAGCDFWFSPGIIPEDKLGNNPWIPVGVPPTINNNKRLYLSLKYYT